LSSGKQSIFTPSERRWIEQYLAIAVRGGFDPDQTFAQAGSYSKPLEGMERTRQAVSESGKRALFDLDQQPPDPDA
jgi:hypothetical protein